MSSPRLARRYAKSVIDLAQEMDRLEPVHQDILLLERIIARSREFVVMLRSPIIHADKKIKIINAVIGGRVSDLTDSFIRLLCVKNRESNLPEIISSFIDQYNTIKGIHTATLTTAVPVGESVLKDFEQKILDSTKVPHLNLEARVDDRLIGGFKLEMEGKLIDASILRELNEVKKQFAGNEYQHRIR